MTKDRVPRDDSRDDLPGEIPKGLVLFPPKTSPAKKTKRLTFVAFYLLVAAALVWPVYPVMAGKIPSLLGLPPSFAWAVIVLAAGFAALLTLYLTEEDGASSALEAPE